MALVAFTLCFAGTAQHGFGQSTIQSTDPLRTIIPVNFDPASGGITIGSTLYKGANPGLHLLAINREQDPGHLDAPDILLDETYTDAASVMSALQTIKQTYTYPTAMVMINAVGSYNIALSSIAGALNDFGAYPDLQGVQQPIPFIFIGTGGANPKTAFQRGFSTRGISGYLAPDSNSNYAFLQTDFVHYDVAVDGTITVGAASYKAADANYKPGCDAAASDSFHLLVVDRESPDVMLADNTYCTGQHPEWLGWMARDLSGVTGENSLVFIATKGHPIPPDWNFGTNGDARVYPLARQFARLGGYFETGVYLTPNDTYSLVGAPAPPAGIPNPRARAKESSSVYPDKPTGELHGVLARGRGNWYSPLNAATNGVPNLGLYDILALPPTSFPQFTADQLNAYKSINQTLCGGDNCIRNAYGNLNVDLGTTFQTPLSNMLDPSGADCDRSQNANLPFCKVRGELIGEIKDAANVHKLYDNISKLWSSSGTITIGSALSAYNDVKATIPAVATAESPSLVRPLVNFFLGLAGNLPIVGQAFGVADTAFNFGMDLTTDSKGNKTVDLTSTIGQLQDQAIDQFIAQGNTNGTLFQMVLQDWGKLSVLGDKLVHDSAPGSPWYWDLNASTPMLQQMKVAVTEAAYQNVMAAAYAIGSYIPQTGGGCDSFGPYPVWGKTPIYQQPWAYGALDGDFKGCNAGTTPVVQPFNSQVGYVPYTYPSDSANPYVNDARTATIMADGSWLGISLQTSPYSGGPAGAYNPPGETLLTNLFKPASQGGLGVYRAAFFEGWPFPRVTCSPSFGVRTPDNSGSYVGGCAWASAATPESLPPPAPTSVSVRATQIGGNQTETDVLLTVNNNGPVPAKSIEITSITLRTLAGSGHATIASPSLPVLIDDLAAGDSTDVVVRLDVPAGVTKLSITEHGTANLGQAEPTRFSDGEVLYPVK